MVFSVGVKHNARGALATSDVQCIMGNGYIGTPPVNRQTN